MTISAVAGTSRSIVSALTTSTGSPLSAPAKANSSVPYGAIHWVASGITGSVPMAMAMGRPFPNDSASINWRTRCCAMIPSRLRPLSCRRYIDVFFPPVFGSRLMDNPKVMNGAGSPSEKIGMGSCVRSTLLPV